ncbi:MAG: complement resistance protein TraT [Caulobacteraceae bacterium]|nr:complement resistance protein TraT [Caulobacteraceae bacterium]
MKVAPPHWLPFLGPLAAAVVGGLVGQYGLGGGFWTVLIAALVGGFVPIIAYRVWKRAHHKREP